MRRTGSASRRVAARGGFSLGPGAAAARRARRVYKSPAESTANEPPAQREPAVELEASRGLELLRHGEQLGSGEVGLVACDDGSAVVVCASALPAATTRAKAAARNRVSAKSPRADAAEHQVGEMSHLVGPRRVDHPGDDLVHRRCDAGRGRTRGRPTRGRRTPRCGAGRAATGSRPASRPGDPAHRSASCLQALGVGQPDHAGDNGLVVAVVGTPHEQGGAEVGGLAAGRRVDVTDDLVEVTRPRQQPGGGGEVARTSHQGRTATRAAPTRHALRRPSAPVRRRSCSPVRPGPAGPRRSGHPP